MRYRSSVAAMAAAVLLVPAAASTVSEGAPAARSYANCTALHRAYPHGVGRSGAKGPGSRKHKASAQLQGQHPDLHTKPPPRPRPRHGRLREALSRAGPASAPHPPSTRGGLPPSCRSPGARSPTRERSQSGTKEAPSPRDRRRWRRTRRPCAVIRSARRSIASAIARLTRPEPAGERAVVGRPPDAAATDDYGVQNMHPDPCQYRS